MPRKRKAAPKTEETAPVEQVEQVESVVEPAVPEPAAPEPKFPTIRRRDKDFQAAWWPLNKKTPPAGAPIEKGKIHNWCFRFTDGAEQRMRPGMVILWRVEKGKNIGGSFFESIQAFQKVYGTGTFAGEPPVTRGSRAIVSGPGRS